MDVKIEPSWKEALRQEFNKDYFEQLLVAGGNAGQYAGVLGDQRTFGVTLRYSF